MSDYFVGEIRMFSFNFAPQDWAFCNGTTLQVQQNVALFSLLGARYGGDGKTTFGLPDLRSRTPVTANYANNPNLIPGINFGTVGGTESVTLTQSNMPAHTHTPVAINANATQPTAGGTALPGANLPAIPTLQSGSTLPSTAPIYVQVSGSTPPLTAISPTAIQPTGSSAPHENRQPFVTTNFCISTIGIYPSRP